MASSELFTSVGRVAQTALIAIGFCASVAHAATDAVTQAASGAVVKKMEGAKVSGQALKKDIPATAGSISVKGGEREFPAGTIPIPPKPKKDALEAAGALKAKAAP